MIKIEDKYERLFSFKEGLAPYYDGEGYGFLNLEGEKTIKAKDKYQYVSAFHNGVASYKDEDGGWGLINPQSDVLIRTKYSEPLIFFGELAHFTEDGKVGFLDKTGDEIIEPEFDAIALPFLKDNSYES